MAAKPFIHMHLAKTPMSISSPVRKGVFLGIGLAVVLAQQLFFAVDRKVLDDRYQLHASRGITVQSRFVYFLYYLGLFPVAIEKPKSALTYSGEGAKRELREGGKKLRTEWWCTPRFGDLGKTYLYLPGALLKGSPRNPSLRPANALAFTGALLLVYFMFWWVGSPGLGILTAILMGSNPFQVFEVYTHDSVFGWPILTAILIFALHLPFLTGRMLTPVYRRIIPLLAGALLATIRQIRTEPILILFAVVMTYLVPKRASGRERCVWVLTLFLSFASALFLWSRYFDHKIHQADLAVSSAGGEVYLGGRTRHHIFWHPIWCGLGDFDHQYGYQWDDIAAITFAMPVLRTRYGVDVPDLPVTPASLERWSLNEKNTYLRSPVLLPHYGEILREDVLDHIFRDPLWYGRILAHRALRILVDTTPVRIGFGRWGFGLPWAGILVPPFCVALAWRRSYAELSMILFFIPTSFTTLLVYSGRGTSYYSSWHIMGASVLLSWALREASQFAQRLRSGERH